MVCKQGYKVQSDDEAIENNVSYENESIDLCVWEKQETIKHLTFNLSSYVWWFVN